MWAVIWWNWACDVKTDTKLCIRSRLVSPYSADGPLTRPWGRCVLQFAMRLSQNHPILTKYLNPLRIARAKSKNGRFSEITSLSHRIKSNQVHDQILMIHLSSGLEFDIYIDFEICVHMRGLAFKPRRVRV